METLLPDLLTPPDAEARLPLIRSIAVELRDRVVELQELSAAGHRAADGGDLRLRTRVRECVAELQGLGAELEGFRPVTVLVPVVGENGAEQLLSWEMDQPGFCSAD